ncbi:MAG: ATP-binding protein [Solirubrobacterales bacterium]|nr:ATP-binding protein [Solirubrobacterales bacterium]
MTRCPYDICDGSGLIFDEERREASDCRCRPQVIAGIRARSLSAVIPEKYRDVGFERFPVTEIEPRIVAATRRFCDRIDQNLDAGKGLWFMGPVGTGKTTLAMLVTQAALAAGRSAARYSLPGLLSQIRRTFDTGGHDDLFDRLAAVDLLHIDDIGAEQTTPWVLEELYSIINARYEERRSVVITTNILDRETLCAQITERTVSRLTEMCDELPLIGVDHRMDVGVA